MNVRYKIGTVSAALFGALGLMVASGPPASAHYSECPDKKFCVWQNQNYDGMIGYSGYDQSYLGNMNDRTTSFWNRTDYTVAIYRDSSYQEGMTGLANYHWCAEVRPGTGVYNIGTQGYNYMNDAISSFRVNAHCSDGGVKIF
ncbi:peptidase inhibitor family I36 protein [Streptomyces sp. NPDC052727]|uniref:peptidase inhibitor family I36 protein n=1 Tax=unclassified Streptomyces TaxID=2593676 RepID=UPI0034449D62